MEATLVCDAATGSAAEIAGKYLTFTLGREEYGVPVLRVREIIQVMDITPVPQMPPHVRGVINLRGKVIPVIDLRARFGLELRAYDDRTCIIVVNAESGLTGLAVDAVCEVLLVSAGDIDRAPAFGGRVRSDFVLGLAKLKASVRILVDLDRVLGDASPAGLGIARR